MADQNNGPDDIPQGYAAALRSVAIFFLILAGLCAALVYADATKNDGRLLWLIVTLSAFGVLIVLLFAGAIYYRILGLSDPQHSMALPRNSIRSLLTFLIFLLLAGFIMYYVQAIWSATGMIKGPADEVTKTVEKLQIKDRITSWAVTPGDDGGGSTAEVRYTVSADEDAIEALKYVLIALLGIASSIIGFYFGQRSGEVPGEPVPDSVPKVEEDVIDVEDDTPEPDSEDGVQPALADPQVEFKKVGVGTFRATLALSEAEQAPGTEVKASFEPSETHDQPWDRANVRTARRGDKVDLVVSNLDDAFDPNGRLLSIYYADQEERAITVPIVYVAEAELAVSE